MGECLILCNNTMFWLIEKHKFFIKESQTYYMGKTFKEATNKQRIPYLLDFPVAYIKFMWLEIQHKFEFGEYARSKRIKK